MYMEWAGSFLFNFPNKSLPSLNKYKSTIFIDIIGLDKYSEYTDDSIDSYNFHYNFTSKEFSKKGTELSGGEAQKLAVTHSLCIQSRPHPCHMTAGKTNKDYQQRAHHNQEF